MTAGGREETGIEALDRVLKGGIPQGLIVLVKGRAGTGKTLFMRQFLLQGNRSGKHTVYILTARDPLNVIELMELYNWKLIPSKLAFFVYQGVISKKKSFIKGNFSSFTYLLIAIDQYLAKHRYKNIRLIFDNLSSLFIGADEESAFSFLKELFVILRRRKITALLEIQSDAHDPQLIAALESLTDATIELRKEYSKRFLTISRMENVPVEFEWIPFELKEGEGIRIVEFYK